jgi:hypothetical protein
MTILEQVALAELNTAHKLLLITHNVSVVNPEKHYVVTV